MTEFIRLAFGDIKAQIKRYIILVFEMLAAFLVIGFLCSMLSGIKMTNQTVNNAGIPADYYHAKSTAVYTDGGRAINDNERQALLIEFIADNFHTEGVVEYPTARHAGVEPKSVFTGIFPPILRQPRSTYASMPSFGFLVLTKICSVKTAMHLTARDFGDSFVPCDAGRLAPVK